MPVRCCEHNYPLNSNCPWCELDQVTEKFDAFRSMVHAALDKIGIDKHESEECRIRNRLNDLLMLMAVRTPQLSGFDLGTAEHFTAVIAVADKPNANGDIFTEESLRMAAESRKEFWFDECRHALMGRFKMGTELDLKPLPFNMEAVTKDDEDATP